MAISVVIPLYNKEKHIVNTISTVLNQTYTDFELIVVDDGSTDQSAQQVAQIQDNRIRLIQKENEGVSKTRNLGVHLAKNELVCFLDADDEWDVTYLDRIVGLSQAFPDAAIYATNYLIIERDGKRITIQYPGINQSEGLIENYFESAFKFTPLWTSAVCVRKSVFEEHCGFPVNIKNGEDLDLWCRIALKHKIAYINEPLAIYRRDSENMLSRSITDPSWYPFLVEYQDDETDLIANKESIKRYIVHRQLEAASAAMFIIKDKHKCQEILNGIKYTECERKKYFGLKILSLFPIRIVNFIYWRIMK